MPITTSIKVARTAAFAEERRGHQSDMPADGVNDAERRQGDHDWQYEQTGSQISSPRQMRQRAEIGGELQRLGAG